MNLLEKPAERSSHPEEAEDCSNYSSSLLNDSFSRIEQQADKIQESLSQIMESNPKQKLPENTKSVHDKKLPDLIVALDNLGKSPNFGCINGMLVEKFWDPLITVSTILANMTWQEVVETPATDILNLPKFGELGIKELLKAIEKAREIAESPETLEPDEETNISNTIENTRKSIQEGIDEIRLKSTALTRGLADVFDQSNSSALLCTYLCQLTIHRRVGKIFRVTEQRIYQLVKEANKALTENLSEMEPELMRRIEFRLSSPACSENTLLKVLGLSELSPQALCLLRILVKTFGAVNPVFRKRVLKTHWSIRSSNFEHIVTKLFTELPLKTKKLSARLEETLVGCSPPEILSVLPPTLFFLRSRELWCVDQEQALVSVLKTSKKPLKVKEIASIFEVGGERPLKTVLSSSNKLARIGKNCGRVYTCLPD